MKCGKCSAEAPTGELRCPGCGSVVSPLGPGEFVPRLQQTRAIELLSGAPPANLWLAEKVPSRDRLWLAEYEPPGGGKAVLRDFNLWYQGLKALHSNVIPTLETRYSHEERLFLVLNAPDGQPVSKMPVSRRSAIPASEFMRRLLIVLRQFNEGTTPRLHGWICGETVTIQPSGELLLGPPVFAPGETADPQVDIKECAFLAADWAGIAVRRSDADVEQRKQLMNTEDWPLGSAVEWILFGKDKAPQSPGEVIEFLEAARGIPDGNTEKDLSSALDTLKELYQRSGSTIVKHRIEDVEKRIPPPKNTAAIPPQPKIEQKAQVHTEIKPEPSPPRIPEPPPSATLPTPPPVAPVVATVIDDQQASRSQESIVPAPTPVSRTWWWIAAFAACAVFAIGYYFASAPLREFDSYFNRGMIVNTNGPSAYAVYQKALNEKGPDSRTIKAMNEEALPAVQKLSNDAFDSWYKESELEKPPERRKPGEVNLTNWDEVVQLQEWLAGIQNNPQSNARYAYARGMAALNRRSWEQARQLFEEALRSQPNWALALNGVGKAYFGLRRYDMTEKYYRLATEADPNWHYPHANLATLYRDVLKNFEASEREYRTAIQIGSNRRSFHFNLGLLYYMQSKQYWPSACSELNAALSAGPGTSLSPAEVQLATQRRDRACRAQ